MDMLWVDTTTDEEARALDRGMWEMVGSEQPDGTFVAQAAGPAPESGEFWYDALNRIKDDPDKRYAMARRHLPLPAAWREMAVSLRMKIRKARKAKAGYEAELRELHHLAAMDSCQSARNVDPLSASNIHPPSISDQRLACPALAGVAEGRPSAGDGYLRL